MPSSSPAKPAAAAPEPGEDALVTQLKLFASYSPAEVVMRYVNHPSPAPPSVEEEEKFEGAIGFVDVSGFTALSEKLNKDHGRKGAELLNQYINSYFKELIDGIFAYQGDVIKFAGDAMQVVWRNRGDSKATLAQLIFRASACCIHLLETLNNYSPPGVDDVTLKLHMGIGAGELSSFYLGGWEGKWEYFVAGEPIEQMSDATDEATHGQLVISKYSYEVLLASDEVTSGARTLFGSVLPSELYLLERIGEGVDASPNRRPSNPNATPLQPRSFLQRQFTSSLDKVVMEEKTPNSSSKKKPDQASVGPEASVSTSKKDRRGTMQHTSMMGAIGGFFTPTQLKRSLSKSDVRNSKTQGDGDGGAAASSTALDKSSHNDLAEGSRFPARTKTRGSKRLQKGGGQLVPEEESFDLMSLLSQIRPTVELDRTLRCFVPSLIEERVQAGQVGAWVSEHRKLVSVFMKVVGLGKKTCEVDDLSTAHEAVRVVQRIMAKYDGTITRLICDDKGTRFLIAYGLPGHASDSDESHAVLSCLYVVKELSRIKSADPAAPFLQVAVGITTGRVFCGEAGSDLRREYTLSGARVNLAARLMQAAGKTAEKGILVDDATYAAAQSTCQWEALDPIKVKGKEELVPIYRPRLGGGRERGITNDLGRSSKSLDGMSLRERSMPAASSAFPGRRIKRTVGRVPEHALLRLGLEQLSNGNGGAIMLTGESGMGKTHLVELLRAMHVKHGFRGSKAGESAEGAEVASNPPLIDDDITQVGLLLNASKPIEQSTPFFMWKAVFQKLFTNRTLSKIRAKTRRVKSQVPDEQPGKKRRGSGGMGGLLMGGLDAMQNMKPFGRGSVDGDLLSGASRGGPSPGPTGADSSTHGGDNYVDRASLQTEGARSESPGVERPTVSFVGAGPKETDSFSKGYRASGGNRRQSQFKPFGQTRSSIDHTAPMPLKKGSQIAASGRIDLGLVEPGKKEVSITEKLKTMWAERKTSAGSNMRGQVSRQRWRDAFSSVLAFHLPAEDVAQGRHCIRPSADDLLLADEAFVELAPLLSPVLDEPIKDNEVTKHMSGETRMSATIELMVMVLAAKLGNTEGQRGEARPRPVIIFEDVHWMDSSSWAVLRRALDVVQPLLVLLTSRPLPKASRPAGYDDIVTKHKVTDNAVNELPAFSEDELGDLVRDNVKGTALECESIQDTFRKFVADRSGGNPFWALELVKSMKENRLIDVDDVGGAKVLTLTVDLDKIEIPSSVEALITSRMDRLPANEQLMMKMGSVMAQAAASFTTMELNFLGNELKLDLPESVDKLDRLVVAEMLERVRGPPHNEYRFKHISLSDVSYSLLPEELKEKLHRAAAQHYMILEKGGPGAVKALKGFDALRRSIGSSKNLNKILGDSAPGTQNLVTKLHYHWSRAGNADDATGYAVHYLTLAGDAALGNYANTEARKLLAQALQLALRSVALADKRGGLQCRMAQCHWGLSEINETRKYLMSSLLSFGAEKGSADDKGFIDTRASDGYHSLSEREFARKYYWLRRNHAISSFFRRALRPPSTIADGSEKTSVRPKQLQLAIAYELLAQVSMEEHQREQAGYCAMKALTLGRRQNTLTPVVGRAYAQLCLVESAAEKSSEKTVRMYRKKAEASCTQLGELNLLMFTLRDAAILDAGQARWEQATDNLAKVRSHADHLKDKKTWEVALCHQAHLEYYRGSFLDSKSIYEQARDSAMERGDKKMANSCNSGIAAVQLAINDSQGAIEILKSTNSHGQHALALLRMNKREEAFEKAMLVKDRFKGKRTKYYVLKAFSSTAEVILKLLEDAISKASKKEARTTMGGSLWTSKSPKNASERRESEGDELGVPKFDDQPTLESLAQEWIDKLDQFANIYAVAKPRALLLKGTFQVVKSQGTTGGNAKKRKSALHILQRSEQVARSLQMPYDQALALYELGKHSGDDAHRKQREGYLTEALRLFQVCGAEYDINRTKRALSGAQGRQKSYLGGMTAIDEGRISTFNSFRTETEVDEDDESSNPRTSNISNASNSNAPDQEDGDRPNAAAPAAAADADGPMAARTSASEAPPLFAEQPVPAAIVPAPKEKRASGAAKAAEGCSMGCGSEPITDSPSDIGRRGLLSDRPRRTPPATPKDENTSASDRITGRGGTNVREWRGPSGASNRPPVEPIAELGTPQRPPAPVPISPKGVSQGMPPSAVAQCTNAAGVAGNTGAPVLAASSGRSPRARNATPI